MELKSSSLPLHFSTEAKVREELKTLDGMFDRHHSERDFKFQETRMSLYSLVMKDLYALRGQITDPAPSFDYDTVLMIFKTLAIKAKYVKFYQQEIESERSKHLDPLVHEMLEQNSDSSTHKRINAR